MLGRMLLGLLEALLFGRARLLFALGLEVVRGDLVAVMPAEDAERSGEQTAEGTAAGPSRTQGSGEPIETGTIHACQPRWVRTKSGRTDQSGILAPEAPHGHPYFWGYGHRTPDTNSVRCRAPQSHRRHLPALLQL